MFDWHGQAGKKRQEVFTHKVTLFKAKHSQYLVCIKVTIETCFKNIKTSDLGLILFGQTRDGPLYLDAWRNTALSQGAFNFNAHQNPLEGFVFISCGCHKSDHKLSGLKQKCVQRNRTDGQQAQEKMLSITNY